MTLLSNLLPISHVQVGIEITSKKRAFEEVGLLFEDLYALSRASVGDSLFARERLGSTGLGHGVAIPHGRIKGLKQPLLAVFLLSEPIGFDAPDEQAVKLLFFLLVPEASNQQHLEILASIAALLGQANIRDALMACQSAQALHEMILEKTAAASG
jgi:PTS system nitrogen regulatory IIA component